MTTHVPNDTAGENKARIIFLSVIAALGGFLFGYDSGVINGTVDALQQAFDSDAVGTGFNVASMLLGCAVGAFFAGNLADKYGRKPILLTTACVFIISAYGSGIAGSSFEFVIYRILGGLAVGSASVIAPAYIGEISPARYRGALISLQQLAIIVGITASFLSNYQIAKLAGGSTETLWLGFGAWSWMFWAEIIPASFFLFALFFIPESPRYLVAAGKYAKAEGVLSRLSSTIDVKKKVDEIKQTVFSEKKSKLSDIISSKTGKLHPIVIAGIGIAMLQQFTGINVVLYYGAVLWQSAGFTEADALFTNVVSGLVMVFGSFVAIVLVDRVGRRPLLMIGGLGQAFMLACMAIIFGFAAQGDAGTLEMNPTEGTLALFAAQGFVLFFSFTWGPIMWVMLGEMFPNRFRGAALAVCGMAQWGSNFLITMTFPLLLTSIGLGLSYGIYSFFGIVAYLFVRKVIVETKGRTLEEMSLELEEQA
ncbi:sugar porter family MFS transporter [Balneolaceae bacterium ANBcel3]|nr:sugar porter family MFS transporter [Balneolaceae bacterium ANBcel3]